jgi:septal ring factor EnvC (AmiA/AmiB activator)
VVYSFANYFFIAPLENEIALVKAETEKTIIRTAKLRNSLKPQVENCQSQNQLDPSFANLTWPVVGAETLSNYEVDNKSLEISLPPRSAIVAVAKGTISSVSDIELHSNPTRKLVVVNHDNHLLSIYAAQSEIVVKIGQPILAGDLIGYSSKEKTGSLHFELSHCYRTINSINFFQN